jgi:hypothetical protein
MTLLNTCGNWKVTIENNTDCFSILWYNCVWFQMSNYIHIVVLLCFNKCIDKFGGWDLILKGLGLPQNLKQLLELYHMQEPKLHKVHQKFPIKGGLWNFVTF